MYADNGMEIVALLSEIGTPPHLVGYKMIHSAIEQMLNNDGHISKITTTLYPLLAANYHTTPQAVERNIRYCIDSTWKYGDIEKLNRLFGEDTKNPFPRVFLGILTRELQMRRIDNQVVTMKREISLYECISCKVVFGIVERNKDCSHIACPVCRSNSAITELGYVMATLANREGTV